MRKCKACGRDFASTDSTNEICYSCNNALKRLNGYAVTVVRCKDCVSGHKQIYSGLIRCNVMGCGGLKPDDFCSYGEGRVGE